MALRLGSATPNKLYLGTVEVTKAYLGATEVYSSSVPLWTPADLGADLKLWLDAEDTATITLNGSNVSQWDDKSGNNFHFANATASGQPAYLATGLNGKPSLRTDGADTLFYEASLLGQNVSGLTAAIVGVHPLGAVFNLNAADFYISNSLALTGTRFNLCISPTGQTANRYSVAGRRLDADTYAGAVSSTSAVTNAGNPWIRIGQRAYSAGVANHWTNGTQDMTNQLVGAQGAGNTSNTTALRSNLFTNNTATGSSPADSQLSEIVVTHSTMTTTDRQKLEGYLAWKWGLEDDLPVDHPYKSAPPTV